MGDTETATPETVEETAEDTVEETGVTEGEPAEEVEQTEEEKEKAKQIEEVNKKLGVPDNKPKKKNDFQTRINELTKNYRDQERKNQELERKYSERDKDLDVLRKHNEELMQVVRNAVSPAPQPEGKTPEAILKELRSNKQDLKAQRIRARSDGDYDKAFEIEDQMHDIQDSIDDVLMTISKGPKEEDIVKVVKKVKQKDSEEDIKQAAFNAIDDFAKRNEWFGEQRPGDNGELLKNEKFDAKKHYMAVGLADALEPNWKGTIPELFKHVEEEVNKQFPSQAAPSTPRAKIPAVGAGNGVGSNQPGKITLTAEQSRVARALFSGDPDAEKKYAEQVRLMRGGK